MIRLTPNPTFEKEVPIALRGGSSDVMAKLTFRALEMGLVMSLLVLSGLLQKTWLVRKWHFAKLCITQRKWVNNLDLLDLMVVGWDEGDTGFDVPYSKQAMLMLIAKDPGVLAKIPLAYFAGLQEEKLKN
ncbi:MAG: phage tail assembly chaperone [Sideroxydans sp.]|jgi:hypothetical protein